MAKVTTPLLSEEASGSIGKTLTFSRWKGVRTVRSYAAPYDPQTAAQLAQRARYTACLTWWRCTITNSTFLSDWQRYALTNTTANMPWNEFMRFHAPAYNDLATGPWVYRVLMQGTLHKFYFYFRRRNDYKSNIPAVSVNPRIHWKPDGGQWAVMPVDMNTTNVIRGATVFTAGVYYTVWLEVAGRRVSGDHYEMHP